MIVRRINPNASELYHHGVKGQRWGIRRYQNYDGTLKGAKAPKKDIVRKKPTELTDEERKIKRNKKIAAAIAITAGVSMIAAAAYVAHNKYTVENVDKIINSENLKRVSINPEDASNITERAYYSSNIADNIKYKGMYGKQLKDQNTFGQGWSKLEPKVYQKSFKAESLKVASNKHARETFNELYSKDANFKNAVDEQLSLYKKYFRGGVKQRNLFNNVTDKNKYDAFNVTLANKDNKAATKFYDALKEKGYDAIHDMNDSKYSGYNAKSAKIVFNGKKVTQTAVKEISSEEINKALADTAVISLVDKYSRYVVPTVATTAMTTGAAGYAYNDTKEKQLKKK